MEVQLAFDPGLNLDAAQFAAAWNGTPDCASVARAEAQPTPATTFLPPEIIATGMTILGGISLNLVSDALYDLIKIALARSGVKKTTEIIQLTQPDGTNLLIVRIVEG
jgi:hypothetical protein